MLNRIFVDTLFVIALVNRRDQYHRQASELAERFDGYPLLVTDAVLLEIGNALSIWTELNYNSTAKPQSRRERRENLARK